MTATMGNWIKPHVWTNAFYLLAGLFVLGTHPVAGAGLIALAIASWLGHDKGLWEIDWAGMYVAMLGVVAANTEPLLFVAAPLVVYASLKWHRDSFVLIGLAWLAAVASAVGTGAPWPWAVGVFAVALWIRQSKGDYDLTHGLWHAVTALGFTMLLPGVWIPIP